jgi:Ca2+/Na+ antiporter
MVAAKGELAFEQDAEEAANLMGRSLQAIDVASDISVGSANGKFC